MNSLARVTVQGAYVPNKVLDNYELERMVETNDEWIVQRTGIRERRIADEQEQTSDLAYYAVKDLENKYNVDITDVDFIIVATLTPDFKTPSVASYIQYKLGIEHAGAIDLNAACAGFTYGLQLANSLISSGMHHKILVIGAETLSKISDYTDRSTCILFGDGAGAFLVESNKDQSSFIGQTNGSNGGKGKNLYATHTANQFDNETLNDHGLIVQNGREVYKWAVTTVPREVNRLLDKVKIDINHIDWFVPHSANQRMLESIAHKLHLPKEKLLTSIQYFGNTSSASIPLAIDSAMKEQKIKNGDKLLLFGFGGGLAYSGLVVEWNVPTA
ncbi:ketoacyl-ACP synthase III [Staphylococcus capitis]|uniref:ketoacyl-ACP synthase III n=1 Tax=Staphylococcus capitis TaxID=29388 RepID=UPI00164329CD|nr:ketoacyl-ACP synthase III [Staphylococcus capitis]MBC3049116.1 ketoacyl-ACP synthase III [Staphylococcus capitis]MBC3069096.1 ketoacyl-ACP synthase III [Staphylococcus capitis]